MEPCPVCGLNLPIHELPEHVQLHLLEDEGDQGLLGSSPTVTHDDQLGRVQCPLGCGAMVLLEELDSHEEAHRLQELESQHKSYQQEQEAAEFEKLQMKFGFSDKRPGKCFRCGAEGHWSRDCNRDCPSNPAAQAARARQPLSTNPADLVRVQQPDPVLQQQRQQGMDVMPLLQACLQAQQKPRTTVYLSGPVTFCGKGRDDAGWGCGYRNIQMQVSHLLAASLQHRQALFGGAGFVPDIPALQAWLEAAWQAGFDPGGAAMLGRVVQCTRKWIGTTEAAAMLRFFGCRALIVEFIDKKDQTGAQGPTIHQGVACDLCGVSPIVGVRHKSYNTPDFDVCSGCSRSPQAQPHAPFFETGSAGSTANGSSSVSHEHALPASPAAAAAADGPPGQPSRNGPGPGRGVGGGAGSSSGQGRNNRKQPYAGERRQGVSRHQALAEWVWAYFSSPGFQGAPGPPPPPAAAAAAGQAGSSRDAFSRLQQAQRPTTVFMSGKPPLYLQHEGHSRTVVGIERTLPPAPQQQKQQRQAPAGNAAGPGHGAPAAAGPEYTLIVLDPGMSQRELVDSLRNRDKWQVKVKRGMHSLARHAELQLLYVAPGVVPEGPERDALKRVTAAERYR